jgi:hypothetical protein
MDRDKRIQYEWLALRCQAGEAGAFDDVIAVMQRPLLYYAMSLTGSEDSALDVLQEVWLGFFGAFTSSETRTRCVPGSNNEMTICANVSAGRRTHPSRDEAARRMGSKRITDSYFDSGYCLLEAGALCCGPADWSEGKDRCEGVAGFAGALATGGVAGAVPLGGAAGALGLEGCAGVLGVPGAPGRAPGCGGIPVGR